MRLVSGADRGYGGKLARREVVDRDRRANPLVGCREARRLGRGEHAANPGGEVMAVGTDCRASRSPRRLCQADTTGPSRPAGYGTPASPTEGR